MVCLLPRQFHRAAGRRRSALHRSSTVRQRAEARELAAETPYERPATDEYFVSIDADTGIADRDVEVDIQDAVAMLVDRGW